MVGGESREKQPFYIDDLNQSEIDGDLWAFRKGIGFERLEVKMGTIT